MEELQFEEEKIQCATILVFVNNLAELDKIKGLIKYEPKNIRTVQYGNGIYGIFKNVELKFDMNTLVNNEHVVKVIINKGE